MTHLANHGSLGIFALQDHEEHVDLGVRHQLAGARVLEIKTPGESETAAQCIPVIDTEDGMGTIGDIHPWFFWQTADREERDTGAWSQAFAGMVVEGRGGGAPGRTSTGAHPSGLLPVRTGAYDADGRFKAKFPNWPVSFSRIPRGTMMIVMAGLDEAHQQEIMMHADSRIIAPNASGPGDAGTLVCDLGPSNEICMSDGGPFGGTGLPGSTGRAARIQSMMRVIPLDDTSGIGSNNSVAWNLAVSGQDGIPGFGLCWVNLESSQTGPSTQTPTNTGPTTGGPSTTGPTTGTGKPGASFGWTGPKGTALASAVSEDGAGGAPEGSGPGRHDADGKRAGEFGTFVRKSTKSSGCAMMSASAGGPFHGGHENDKHRIGLDRDGNAINSGHIATAAFYYRQKKEDGPLAFEGDYPNPGGMPLLSRVHLGWDNDSETWRWWCEVPLCCPDSKKPDKPKVPPFLPNPPKGPTTPGSSPPNPGGGGGPTPGPSKPTTQPPTPRPSPGTPGQTVPSGGGGVSTRPAAGGPTTPGPFGPYPPGAGYGWRAPGSPKPTGGPTTPSPGVLPGGNIIPQGPAFGGRGVPGEEPEPEPGAAGPTTGRGGKLPEIIPQGPAFGGKGVPPTDPEPGPRETKSIDTVGKTSTEDRSLHTILYPMLMGFTGMSFRPQLWVAEENSYLHNNFLDAAEAKNDEIERPQVMAMHSFGGVDTQSGTWSYVTGPDASRARGGTANGGVMYTPPQWEPEDYFGIGSSEDITASDTDSVVMVTPGVAFALGTPNVDGSLAATSVTLKQDLSDATNRPLLISQHDSAGVAQPVLSLGINQSTGEGTVLFPDGTAALPGISFVADPNTGIYRPTTDEIAISVAGSEAFRVDAAGQIGIGTNNPNKLLHVAGTGQFDSDVFFGALADASIGHDGTDLVATPDLVGSGAFKVDGKFEVSSAADGDLLVDSSGRVGIGTPSPTNLLDVHGNNPVMRLNDDDSTIRHSALKLQTAGGTFTLQNGTGVGTNSEFHIDQGGSNLVTLRRGSEGGGLGVNATPATTERFVVDTTGGAGSLTILDASGNVGVGTTSPDEILEVNGNIYLQDSDKHLLGTGKDAEVYFDGTDLIINPDAVGLGNLKIQSDVELVDNDKLVLGTGDDAQIYYDATDLVLNPKAAGTGAVLVKGDINVEVTDSSGAYQADGVDGLTATRIFEDGAVTNTVTIAGGIITAWTQV